MRKSANRNTTTCSLIPVAGLTDTCSRRGGEGGVKGREGRVKWMEGKVKQIEGMEEREERVKEEG